MRFFKFALIFLLLLNCSNNNTKHNNLTDFIPENTSVVIKVTNKESFSSSIENNDFLKSLSKSPSIKSVKEQLNYLSLLNPANDVLICFSRDDTDSLQVSLITKYSKDLFQRDSLKIYTEEKLTTKNETIIKSTFNNQTFYTAIIDSTFFSSSSNFLTKGVFNQTSKNIDFKQIYATTIDDKTASIILKNSNDNLITSFFPDSLISFSNFSNYTAVDLDISQDKILLNGITQAKDSLNSFINIFKKTIPQENLIQEITPLNSDGFLSFTFDNYHLFQSNLNNFNKVDSLNIFSPLFDNIVEVGVIYDSNHQAIVLNSLDENSTLDNLLNEDTSMETFRQVEIFNFSQPNLFKKLFSPLISFEKASKYCVLDNFFVFADNLEFLQSIITNYQNKTTLGKQSYFIDIKEELSDASSLLLVLNPPLLNDVLNNNLNSVDIKTIENYKTTALQFVYDSNFAHVNGIVKKAKAKALKNTVTEELNITLENEILNNPQFVVNHLNKQKEIVVQDIKNNLYLISNTGKILWKKQLNGPVLGLIEQIDIYKNGRLQLVFATPNRVYILDRNGRDVKPFPANFNDNITQPLSVFDYDKNKNYRLLVTQGKNLLMLDKNRKTVRGFNFKQANSEIISQPQHYRIGKKDYLVFKTQTQMYILDRTGNKRVNPKTTSNFSSEPILLYKDKFTTTDPSGNLISIDTKGNSVSQNLNLSEQHHIEASSKSLVTLNDNKLTIKGNTYELDFGIYTAPKLFYLQDKIYVAVTDLQTQKVYLFDSNAKLLPNFPIYGNASIRLDNIDKDRDLEFVTKGDNNSIILYQIN
jgi:hypothetical protein